LGNGAHDQHYHIQDTPFVPAYPQGLEPVFLTVPGSIAAYDELSKGTYDLLTASIDNTIGRYLGGIDSARVLGGVTTGAGLALWARPEIKSPKDLAVRMAGAYSTHAGEVSEHRLLTERAVHSVIWMNQSIFYFYNFVFNTQQLLVCLSSH
jgi:hypothetical protein